MRLRDYVAHPERHRLDMPPEVIGHLRDSAEIINRLWGRDTEGGRLFPGPVSRRPRAAALSPGREAAVTFGSLPLVLLEQDKGDWTYALYLCADGEELIDFDWDDPGHQRFLHTPGLQMTQYPAELLWGPGPREGLVAALVDFDDTTPTDSVAFLDRVFYIRVTAGAARPDFPRNAADLLGSGLSDNSAVWYVVQADFPMDAWILVRDSADVIAGRASETGLIARLIGDGEAARHARESLS